LCGCVDTEIILLYNAWQELKLRRLMCILVASQNVRTASPSEALAQAVLNGDPEKPTKLSMMVDNNLSWMQKELQLRARRI
jgi:hypothetical protein